MGTCSSMGQAVGTAAALAAARGVQPADVMESMGELQQQLLADDCYLPRVRQELPQLTRAARLEASQGDPEPVRDGFGRPVKEDMHCWTWRPGDWIAYAFGRPTMVREVVLALDSALERDIAISLYGGHRHHACDRVPEVMPKRLRIEGLTGGTWEPVGALDGNYQRFLRVPVGRELEGVRVTLDETWGTGESRLYAFYAR
jgi:hypothetical protein